MLGFAVKLTEAPDGVEEANRQVLREAGFSDRDIWDIAAVAAFYNMSNRLATATGMRPNRQYHYLMRAGDAAGEAVREADRAVARPASRIGRRRRG